MLRFRQWNSKQCTSIHFSYASPCLNIFPLQWRHNGNDGVSNHQPHDCLLNRLIRRRSKKTSKLRVTGLCVGNSPGTGEFPAQMASNAEKLMTSSCIKIHTDKIHIQICFFVTFVQYSTWINEYRVLNLPIISFSTFNPGKCWYGNPYQGMKRQSLRRP